MFAAIGQAELPCRQHHTIYGCMLHTKQLVVRLVAGTHMAAAGV
jgi:hypothetical protein